MPKSNNIFHFLNIYDNITSFRTHHTYKDNKIGRSVYKTNNFWYKIGLRVQFVTYQAT